MLDKNDRLRVLTTLNKAKVILYGVVTNVDSQPLFEIAGIVRADNTKEVTTEKNIRAIYITERFVHQRISLGDLACEGDDKYELIQRDEIPFIFISRIQNILAEINN